MQRTCFLLLFFSLLRSVNLPGIFSVVAEPLFSASFILLSLGFFVPPFPLTELFFTQSPPSLQLVGPKGERVYSRVLFVVVSFSLLHPLNSCGFYSPSLAYISRSLCLPTQAQKLELKKEKRKKKSASRCQRVGNSAAESPFSPNFP